MQERVKPLFITAEEIAKDWGISKGKAYDIIVKLSKELKKENPKALIIQGRLNRAFYEECCGTKKAQ